jgi:hypothetical protein
MDPIGFIAIFSDNSLGVENRVRISRKVPRGPKSREERARSMSKKL